MRTRSSPRSDPTNRASTKPGAIHGIKIAPSTYYEARSRRPSRRALRDAELVALIKAERARQKLLARLGLSLNRFETIEINEAFAAQVLACLRQLGVPDDAAQVNPNGGAIALGHPLGMSGARLALTAMREMERSKGTYALCTLCVGVGQGLALALERV